jgi:hypothetical protein
MSFIDFKAIKAVVSIEDAANVLKLSLKKIGNQLRGSCPACGNQDERIVVITPSRGLFLLLRCEGWRRLFGSRPAHNRVALRQGASNFFVWSQ